jgi:hypothetical protein
LSDIDGSDIAPAIIESCPTRLLLPNERAIEPQITAIYRRFGLNDRQIEILARATPKRDYYCQSRRGNRLFELGLSEIGLALCAASSKTDQTLIASVVAEHGVDYHWAELFKAAALSTILSVGAEAGSSGQESDVVRALRQGASDSVSQTGQQIVQRQLNIAPTLNIRPGFPVRVVVTHDLVLEPYEG